MTLAVQFEPSAVGSPPSENGTLAPRHAAAVAYVTNRFLGRNGVNLVSDYQHADGALGIVVQTSGYGWPHGLPNRVDTYPVSVVHGEMTDASTESDLGWSFDEVLNVMTLGGSGLIKEAVAGPTGPTEAELAEQRAVGLDAMQSGTQTFTGSRGSAEVFQPSSVSGGSPSYPSYRPAPSGGSPSGPVGPGSNSGGGSSGTGSGEDKDEPFYARTWFAPTAILIGAVVVAGGVFWWGRRAKSEPEA